MAKGLFIVIDGTDGSGKTTQAALLAAKLKKLGHKIEMADFPQYNQKSAGLVEEYLGGKYGQADEVSPYVASIFYASDRYDASFKIRKWLAAGKIVISNRYVTANMGHQGAKFKNKTERKRYITWLYDLEYNIFKIPKPNLNIILHVPAKISQQLSQNRKREDWHGKKKDIHEDNLSHLEAAEKTYLEIAKIYPGFCLIECTKGGQMMEVSEIGKIVFKKIEKLLIRK